MAELLVRAKKHWMDDLTQKEVDAMKDKSAYESRCQIGDVVVVKPDGWKWGKCECLPDFIVIKIPGMTEAEAKKYEEALTKEVDGKEEGMKEIQIVRFRKHALPKADIDSAVTAKTESVELSKTTLTSKVITKSGLSSEFASPKKDVK